MASKCKTCGDEILSSEFIKCNGACANVFHSKCVSIGKALLNALGGNPNIRWYCHDCHINDSNIVSSVNEIKNSISQLSGSLSSDLGKFLCSMSDMTKCVSDSLKSLSAAKDGNNVDPTASISSKRRRDDAFPTNPMKFRRVTSRSTHTSSIASNAEHGYNNNNPSSTNRSSIVVSNIAPDITIETLTKFLVSKLKTDNDSVRITTLMPRSIKATDVKFMQYRISFPDSVYNFIRDQSLWPVGVRIRDFVFKRAKTTTTSGPPVYISKFVVHNNDQSTNMNSSVPNEDFPIAPTNAAITLQNVNPNQLDPLNQMD